MAPPLPREAGGTPKAGGWVSGIFTVLPPWLCTGSHRSQTFFASCFCHLSLFLEHPLQGWEIKRGHASAVAGGFWTCCQCMLRASHSDGVAPRTVLPDPLVSSLPQHFSTDPVAASIMKIHTFNKDRDRVKLGVDTIAK